jgi:hypothetical protein
VFEAMHNNAAEPLLQEHAILMTGELSGEQKNLVLEMFRAGVCRLLISTVVIEVGIDLPDATLMVIEHAERFGLLQLHQLRGRVGRSDKQSECMLVTTGNTAMERLSVLAVRCVCCRSRDLVLRFVLESLSLPPGHLRSLLRHVQPLAHGAAAVVGALPANQASANACRKRMTDSRWHLRTCGCGAPASSLDSGSQAMPPLASARSSPQQISPPTSATSRMPASAL